MLTYKRGKRKVLADYKFDEIYQFYKEMRGDEAFSKPIVHEIYKKLFPEIIKLIIFENIDYRMPARLGYLRIKKKLVEVKLDKNGKVDARKLSVNWKDTKKYWKEIYPDKTQEEIKVIKGKHLIRELNEGTDGYRMIWFWDKTTCNLKNQAVYYIDMSRWNDRILSRGIRFNHLNFYK